MNKPLGNTYFALQGVSIDFNSNIGDTEIRISWIILTSTWITKSTTNVKLQLQIWRIQYTNFSKSLHFFGNQKLSNYQSTANNNNMLIAVSGSHARQRFPSLLAKYILCWVYVANANSLLPVLSIDGKCRVLLSVFQKYYKNIFIPWNGFNGICSNYKKAP